MPGALCSGQDLLEFPISETVIIELIAAAAMFNLTAIFRIRMLLSSRRKGTSSDWPVRSTQIAVTGFLDPETRAVDL